MPKPNQNLMVTLTLKPHFEPEKWLQTREDWCACPLLVPTSIVVCQFLVLTKMPKQEHTHMGL